MPTPFPTHRLAEDFVRAVVHGGAAEWREGAERMSAFDGDEWLLLDASVRSRTWSVRRNGRWRWWWIGHRLAEPSGFVAAVRGMDADGHVRQRAVDALAGGPGPVRAAALAVRALDHVPQVREAALRGLDAGRDAEVAEAVLAVLLAGGRRRHAPAALAAVRAALTRDARTAGLVVALTGSRRRSVRRWAFELAHEQRLLPPRRLLAVADSDRDQLLAAKCAGWLIEVASREEVVALLGVRSREARAAALSRVTDADLDDAVLLAMLADRAPRLREVARWRARRRGIDVAGWYRTRLAAPALSPGVRAACLDGLRRVGGPADLELFRSGLGDPSPSVRVAAAGGVGAVAPGAQVPELVGPLLLDPSPRVSATATRVLAEARSTGAGTAAEWTALAWAAPRPSSRRAAWRLDRGAGGWGRVEADLRAAGDPDPDLAAAGHAGVRTWLVSSAATTWDVLPPARRERIRALLDTWDAPERDRRAVAFHAGIDRPAGGAPVGTR